MVGYLSKANSEEVEWKAEKGKYNGMKFNIYTYPTKMWWSRD